MACAVAEIPYNSRVTELEEKLPFAVTVMGNAGEWEYLCHHLHLTAILTFLGTDLVLMDTILNILKEAGLPTTLRTGKTMF